MLVPSPFAYLLGSAAIDVWSRVTGRRRYLRTAAHMNTLGLGSAVAAAVPGLIDYAFAVPPKSSARTRATYHMLVNLTAVGLFAAARAIHARILPLMQINFVETNPIPVKAAMAAMGLLEEVYRLPMCAPKPDSRDKVLKVLKQLELLKGALV